ncbi:sensor histidine kinase [Curtobacterium caseinilyticum]|uniref:histidine kinase n=1 Tax=Curtobacterium caseinilyticum TaxID=3055137 RepID=A0ABT7TNP6_9MICO|nr:sensor histidine kinase [Curtobacterium caseinilyticum]MDM7891219.1 sensor histidine kinase [Curtobacterium caseinilyticum]
MFRTLPAAPVATDDDRPRGGRRFARIGRVLPVAVVQVGGTLLAARLPDGPVGAAHGGPPWLPHGSGASLADGAAPGVLAVVLLVAGVLVLPWRWRWPTAVLVTTLATTIGYALVVSPRGPFVAALTMAAVNAWLRGRRTAVVVVLSAAAAVLPTADDVLGRTSGRNLDAVFLAVAWVAVTLSVAELVRVRLERAAERRRRRAETEAERARDERVRIARELHDSVAHSMALINLQAGVALHLGSDLPDPTRQSLADIRDTSRDALVELRTILGVLRGVDDQDARTTGGDEQLERAPAPGLDRLSDLVDRARAAGIDLGAHVDGDPMTLDRATDRTAFRIVQEAVTNVMKHAPRHRAVVEVRVGPDVVDLVVEDGPGVDPDAGAPTARSLLGPSGNGIIGMRERAMAVGGTLEAGPTPARGWRVSARLPVVSPTTATAPAPDVVRAPAPDVVAAPAPGTADEARR